MHAMSEEAAVRREVVPMNLLIVDDEQSIRETCATVSEQCGMKAVAVATAEEALEVLEHSPIDILLTDLKLQQTNGVELLKLVHDVHPDTEDAENRGKKLKGKKEKRNQKEAAREKERREETK